MRTFGFLLKDTSRLYVERFEQRAGALGLTLPQCKALVYLADHEGISQVQLAELTDLEPMTLVRTLDCLESHGWLEPPQPVPPVAPLRSEPVNASAVESRRGRSTSQP